MIVCSIFPSFVQIMFILCSKREEKIKEGQFKCLCTLLKSTKFLLTALIYKVFYGIHRSESAKVKVAFDFTDIVTLLTHSRYTTTTNPISISLYVIVINWKTAQTSIYSFYIYHLF